MSLELISTISSCVSTVVTCVAFIVAYLTFKKQYATKLKFDVSKEPSLFADFRENSQDYGMKIKISNVSNQPVMIEEIVFGIESCDTFIACPNFKPIRLEPAEIVTGAILIPTETVIRKLWCDAPKGNEKKKVCFVVESTSGKHIIKTDAILRDLLVLRRSHPDAEAITEDPEKDRALMKIAMEQK